MKTGHIPVTGKWSLAVVLIFALLPLGHGRAGNLEYGIGSWQVPPGQPDQTWSRVHYDQKLTDPFFNSNEWSYPWWIIKHPDGSFQSTMNDDERPVKDPPQLKHTANFFSTSFESKHLVRFCEARLLDVNSIDLLIHEFSPAFRDALRVQIRKKEFTSQYWTFYVAGPPPDAYIWTTKRQELTLDKIAYQKGEMIKGRVYFECLQENADPRLVAKYGKDPTTIKVYGAFKTVVE